MSYIITSNTSDLVQSPITEGINKPFSYFNNINETHLIPKNSEIAVQSLKYNKQGNIEVNRANNQFYLYLGTKPTALASINTTTSHPSMTWVSDINGNTEGQFNTDSLASAIERSCRRAIYHPNWLPTVKNPNFPNVVVKRNACGVDFQGFQFEFKGSATSDNASQINKSIHWRNAEVFGDGDLTLADDNVTSTFGRPQSVIGVQYPLSLTGGVFNCSVTSMDGTKDDWEVGLTRCTRTEDFDGTPSVDLEAPSYFNRQRNYYDYVLTNADFGNGSRVLKLFHSTTDINTGELSLTEMDYRQKLGLANYIEQNASFIDRVKWTCTNEQVKCELLTSKGGTIVLCDGLQALVSRNLKPINQCCWTLYPKLTIPAGKKFRINTFNGIDLDVNNFDPVNKLYGSQSSKAGSGRSNRQTNTDWWATQVNLSREQLYCKEVDSRYMIHTGNVVAYTQLGLNANNGVEKDIVMVLTESDLYKPSRFASAQRLLGFQSRGVVDQPSAQSGNKITFVSDEAPHMISTDSIFVRLKNMTFQSVNFSKKSTSKILYHVPRFDNAGNEFNSLFFEPNQRVYLKLNNVQDIYLNNMEVDLVNANETLADNVTGKTICCFHIRESV